MRIRLLVLAALACCWGSFSGQASAQTISCASQNNSRQYCAADTRGGVTLVRQLSQSPCIQDQSWGYDGRGIWVDRGCRAEFRAGNNGGGPGGPAGGPGTVTCESRNNSRNYCRIPDPRSTVTLNRQLSQAQCVRGQSWGNDGQGIWVDRGCRAIFEVSVYSGNGPGGWWNSGHGHKPGGGMRDGACFFTEANFRGDYFCLNRGSDVNAMPPGYNDRISAIQIFGRAYVTIFAEQNFRGDAAPIRQSVSDLRNYRVPGTNKSWNNRISSVRAN